MPQPQVPLEVSNRKSIIILLVEDEFFIRADLASELRDAGFQVVEAANAEEALAFLEAGEVPDLIFTDIQMSGAMNGLALADRARARYPALPVVIGSGDIEKQKAAARLGMFVPKPYNSKHIVELVTDIVGPPPNAQ